MAFELLNELLQKSGLQPVGKEIVESATESIDKTATNRLKESDISYAELDSLLETAMKESLQSVIKEQNLGESASEVVENTRFDESQVYTFLTDTVDPILETVGTLNSGKLIESNRVKGVNLPIYEIALTLESARLGALTMESLDDVCIKEDVDPDAQELEDIVTAITNGGEADTTYDFGKNADKESKFRKGSNKSGVIGEATLASLTDTHQYAKNKTQKLAKDGGGSAPKQPNRDTDVPTSEDELNDYEGDEAGNPEDGLFDTFEDSFDENSNLTVLGRVYNKLMEDIRKEEELETEYTPKSAKALRTYGGKEAGTPGPGASGAGQLKGDGTAEDTTIAEQQTVIAKYLLGKIFKEYGIEDQDTRQSMVREAVHYIFKYGVKNLCPAVSDVAQLVSEQNKLSDLNNEVPSSAYIVENTRPVLSEAQVASLEEKALFMAEGLLEAGKASKVAKNAPRNVNEKEMAVANSGVGFSSKESKDGECMCKEDAKQVLEAVAHITHSAGVERTRQAFRYRLNKFNESAKIAVSGSWVIKESNLSEAAEELKPFITVRKYVSEAQDMKEYFEMLREDSPVYSASIKKSILGNDGLVSAAIFTEVVSIWKNLKTNLYNGQDLESKHVALSAMIETAQNYKRLVSAVRNPEKTNTVLENFAYRLQSLKDKVEYKLSETE